MRCFRSYRQFTRYAWFYTSLLVMRQGCCSSPRGGSGSKDQQMFAPPRVEGASFLFIFAIQTITTIWIAQWEVMNASLLTDFQFRSSIRRRRPFANTIRTLVEMSTQKCSIVILVAHTPPTKALLAMGLQYAIFGRFLYIAVSKRASQLRRRLRTIRPPASGNTNQNYPHWLHKIIQENKSVQITLKNCR